jgi:hypothetical protein
MIKLLGKYHAYAPPFRYDPAGGGAPYIGGIDGRVEWNADLANQLRQAWDQAHTRLVTREFKFNSASQPGVVRTVKKLLTGWVCDCPARGNCWHIKYAKTIDVATTDDLEFSRRENDYKSGVDE